MKRIYKLTTFWVTLVLWLIMFHTPVLGKTIYVDSNAFGANNGSSWMDAYNYLQDALADANDSEKPIEICVAQGIYKPDQGAGIIPGDREATFQLINSVTLTGGYAGSNEAEPNARDTSLYETVLSGDLYGDDDLSQFKDYAVLLCRQYRSYEEPEELNEAREEFYEYLENIAHMNDNSYSVVTVRSPNHTAVLDGFTVTGGNSYMLDNGILYGDKGAGIKIEKAYPVIKDCMVRHNVAGSSGGGLASMYSHTTIYGCRFELNFSGRDGGGLWHELGSPAITECTFIQNYALDDAGGVYFSYEGKPTLENCHIESNVARDDGGGIYCSRGWDSTGQCAPLIKGNTIIGNIALNGGGIACKKYPVPVIVDNLLKANRALDDGGAMYLRYSECQVHRNQIEGNCASDDGGGIYLKIDWGEIIEGFKGDSTFTNNRIIANTAFDNGGGIYCQNASPNIANCVIALNYAEDGAGLWCRAMERENTEIEILSEPILRNVTIYGNISAESGGAVCCRWGADLKIIDSIIWANTSPSHYHIAAIDDSQLKITNSCIEYGWPGIGNINSDPLIFDPGHRNRTLLYPQDDTYIEGDYHLMSKAGRWDPNSQSWVNDDVTSLCIDAGDPNSSLVYEPFPNGGVINMGAYGSTSEASKSTSGYSFGYGGGTGEPNNPYLIYTAEQLNAIGTVPEDWDKHFRLIEDIDLAAYTDTQFNLIGRYIGWLDTNNIPFTGVFDGNNKTIYNFTWNSSDIGCIGLFRIVGEGALIKNLRMENVDIRAGVRIGAIIGLNANGTVEHCSVTGTVASDDEEVGGLIGRNIGTLNRSYFVGTVSGQYEVGGLVGAVGGSIYRCWFDGNVTGIDHVGGLIGEHSGSVSISVARGTVSGNNYVGGIVGYNDDGNISNSYSIASVSGNDYVGGLVGSNLRDEDGAVLYHCYAAGPVIGKGQNTGGLAGGGGGSAEASFWDIEVTGQSTSIIGTGKTTDEMLRRDTYTDAGWDFVEETANGNENIWWIPGGRNYPRLPIGFIYEN